MNQLPRAGEIGKAAGAMLDYVEHDRTQQTDKIMRIPSASYVDPDHWQREIDHVFKRCR